MFLQQYIIHDLYILLLGILDCRHSISTHYASLFDRDEEYRALIGKLLAGQFCFVQIEDGHVVEVYHEEGSHPEGLNLKKTIAAAFQANFRNQEEEEEQDPQSLHVAHYRYIT